MEQLAIAIRLRVGFIRWKAHNATYQPRWNLVVDGEKDRAFFARVYGPDHTLYA